MELLVRMFPIFRWRVLLMVESAEDMLDEKVGDCGALAAFFFSVNQFAASGNFDKHQMLLA